MTIFLIYKPVLTFPSLLVTFCIKRFKIHISHRVYVCMYVCMYYVCMYVCVCMYVYMYVYTYVCEYVCMYVLCMYVLCVFMDLKTRQTMYALRNNVVRS